MKNSLEAEIAAEHGISLWPKLLAVHKSKHADVCCQVLDALKTKGIAIRVASPKLVMEEAPESYKVSQYMH